MTLDERIAACDREAIYDAIVECREHLDEVRARLGRLLVDDAETLDRLAEMKSLRRWHGEPPIRGRKATQDTAGTAASGKEPQRSGINRSKSASHGR